MWPLVQSHDGCTFHPIQAATARDANDRWRWILEKQATTRIAYAALMPLPIEVEGDVGNLP